MRKDLMEILACPVCKQSLQLEVTEENDKEIVAGLLKCASCSFDYPIKDTIANLLPPELQDSK